MNIYFGIPSGDQANLEETIITKRLIQSLANVPCHTRDFTTDDPYPFEALKGTPSLIHAFNLAKAGIPCLKLAESSRLPLVVSCVGPDVFIDLLNPGLKVQIQAVLENAGKIIIPFSQMAKFIQARFQTSASFEVITPGVLPPFSEMEFPKSHFGYEQDDQVILIDGGLLPLKNTLFAIHQIEKILKDFPNIRLGILGDPFDEQTKQQIFSEISNRPWVRILERPEPEMTIFLYKIASAFVNVSHVEGYNPFLLDAMMAGLPIVASDIPGNHAFIRNESNFPDSGTGLLYFTSPAPASYKRIHDGDDFILKLRSVLQEPERFKLMGKRAYDCVKTSNNPSKEIYMHIQLYKSLLKNKSPQNRIGSADLV